MKVTTELGFERQIVVTMSADEFAILKRDGEVAADTWAEGQTLGKVTIRREARQDPPPGDS